jgi:hypothetical protein
VLVLQELLLLCCGEATSASMMQAPSLPQSCCGCSCSSRLLLPCIRK